MNPEDRAVELAEEDARSPHRYQQPELATPPQGSGAEPIERVETRASSNSAASILSGEGGISRFPTQRDDLSGLERHPTALSRIETHRSQHSATVGSGLRSRTSTRQSKPLPNFGAGKPFPPPLPDREEYVVEFDGPDDPMHAQNWPNAKKLRIGIALGYVTLTAAFGSSIFSAAITSVEDAFDLSEEVATLGISLYVLGFATGPIIWAPFSELYGRKPPLLISSFIFILFSVAVATAKDAQTVFLCRFFSGFMGACPLTCVGAVFADMYNNKERGIAITVFSVCVFSGPLLAPFIGGFIDINPSLGWRWTEYITAIMAALGLGLLFLLMEETYPPVILVHKAAELRRKTKNWGIHAKQEEIEVNLRELFEKNLSRPLRMLFTEPIVLAISLYMSFVYGLLYLMLVFYPIIFQEVHGMNEGVGGLPYFGMIVGEVIAAIFMLILQPGYVRKLTANNNMPIPEWRLPPVIIGGVFFSLGIFWLGWSGYKESTPWIVPALSGLFTGFGIMSIFLQCLNYLIDAYLMFAASAIAANTFLRSIFGAVFPLFARYMIDGMGIQWAGTLLGCVAMALVPLPVIFYYKGDVIRQRSHFAPTFPLAAGASSHPGQGSSGSDKDVEKEGKAQ